jgi:Fe-S-cluster containining protein
MNITPDQIFEDYASKTYQGLKRVKKPTDHFKILKDRSSDSDTQIESTKQAEGVALACRTGCNFCCYLKVDVRAIEVFRIVEYLYRRLSQDLPQIKERCDAHYEAILPLSFMEHIGSNHLCPLNVNGNCLAYDVRPFACRNFHAQKVETCEYSHVHPTDLESPSSQHPTIETMGKAALYGVFTAYDELGYDSNTYDLGAALHNTFKNPKAFKRWRDKKSAFPIECRVKQPKED